MCAHCTLISPLKKQSKNCGGPEADYKHPTRDLETDPLTSDVSLGTLSIHRLKQPKTLEARRLEARRLDAQRLEARGLEVRGWSCCSSMVVRGAVAAPPEEWTPILFASGDTRQVYRTLR